VFGFCGVCYSWHFHRQASGGVGLGRYWSISKISAVDVLSSAGKLALWRESRRGVMNDCSPDSRSPLGVFPGLGRHGRRSFWDLSASNPLHVPGPPLYGEVGIVNSTLRSNRNDDGTQPDFADINLLLTKMVLTLGSSFQVHSLCLRPGRYRRNPE